MEETIKLNFIFLEVIWIKDLLFQMVIMNELLLA